MYPLKYGKSSAADCVVRLKNEQGKVVVEMEVEVREAAPRAQL